MYPVAGARSVRRPNGPWPDTELAAERGAVVLLARGKASTGKVQSSGQRAIPWRPWYNGATARKSFPLPRISGRESLHDPQAGPTLSGKQLGQNPNADW